MEDPYQDPYDVGGWLIVIVTVGVPVLIAVTVVVLILLDFVFN